MLSTPERLVAVQGMEAHFRAAMDTVTAKLTDDEQERFDLAVATVTLMLKRMYRTQNDAWLTSVVEAVMKP